MTAKKDELVVKAVKQAEKKEVNYQENSRDVSERLQRLSINLVEQKEEPERAVDMQPQEYVEERELEESEGSSQPYNEEQERADNMVKLWAGYNKVEVASSIINWCKKYL